MHLYVVYFSTDQRVQTDWRGPLSHIRSVFSNDGIFGPACCRWSAYPPLFTLYLPPPLELCRPFQPQQDKWEIATCILSLSLCVALWLIVFCYEGLLQASKLACRFSPSCDGEGSFRSPVPPAVHSYKYPKDIATSEASGRIHWRATYSICHDNSEQRFKLCEWYFCVTRITVWVWQIWHLLSKLGVTVEVRSFEGTYLR